MAATLLGLCAFYNLIDPPQLSIEGEAFQLYPISKRLCPEFNIYKDTIFELYTRKNPLDPQKLILYDDESIKKSNINFQHPTIIFFHGFLESTQADDAFQLKLNYLRERDVNVILGNNERLLAGPYYLHASKNVAPIGEYAAKFVDYLTTQGLDLKKLHIIGMSLGAQIAGLTGKHMKSGKASRLTGFDPAGPYFNSLPPDERINENDAEFVDIIHTNAGIFGVKYSCGHVDIWVNGGTKQPGCSFLEAFARAPGYSELTFCSHWQSYRMYVMSLKNSTAYPIKKCANYALYKSGACDKNEETYLGIDIDRKARGNYYIDVGKTALDI